MNPLTITAEARLAFGLALFLVGAGVVSLVLASPPKPVPDRAPPTVFSAQRAFRHVQAIARTPRPAGSAANAAARKYILKELLGLGIEAEIETAQYVEGRRAAHVHNVLARLPGRANTKAVTLMAHHDSVRYGPGAADDGASVAAMIETARALKAGPQLSNDVLLVFTDGEESGLLGAKVFVRHPWAAQTGALVGLESRGTSGGSLIFETSSSNGWLIAELAQASVGAFASSLSGSIYESLPFNGDFSWLKNRGQHGFHTSFIGDFAWYHTGNDRPEHLSLASLQHQGNYGLGLARHFGNLPLHNVTAPDAVYFSAIGSWLVHYPETWGLPFAAVAGAMLVLALIIGLCRRRLSPIGLLAGTGVFAGTALAAALVALFVAALIFGPINLLTIYRSGVRYLPELRPLYQNDLYGFAFALGAIGLFGACFNLARRKISALDLAAGALLWWGVLLLILQRWLPGGSYLATWPTLFAALQLLVLVALPSEKAISADAITGLAPLTLPAIFLLVPGYRYLLSSVLIITGPGLVLIPVLLCGLLIPQLDVITRAWKWWTAALPGATAGALLLTGALTNGVSPEKPNFNCLAYGLDRDANQAFWMSSDPAPDEWTEQFFPPGTPRTNVADFFPRFGGPCLRAPAPLADLAGADVRVIEDLVRNGRRHLALRIASPDQAPNLKLQVTSETEVFRATVFGERVPGARRAWDFNFTIFPPEGADVHLELPPDAPLWLQVVEQHFGLPALPEIRPRPEYLLCEPNTLKHNRSIGSDQVLVRRIFTF